MRAGLLPIHWVQTMTWTAEMAGTASSGVFVMAQMPHAVSTTVPVNTTKRFAAHQSMVRLIITCILAGPHRRSMALRRSLRIAVLAPAAGASAPAPGVAWRQAADHRARP